MGLVRHLLVSFGLFTCSEDSLSSACLRVSKTATFVVRESQKLAKMDQKWYFTMFFEKSHFFNIIDLKLSLVYSTT
jgi:hypothetical protein